MPQLTFSLTSQKHRNRVAPTVRYHSCHQSIVVCSSPTSRFERERKRDREREWETRQQSHTQREATPHPLHDTTTQLNPEIQIDLGPIGGEDDDDDDDGAFSFPFQIPNPRWQDLLPRRSGRGSNKIYQNSAAKYLSGFISVEKKSKEWKHSGNDVIENRGFELSGKGILQAFANRNSSVYIRQRRRMVSLPPKDLASFGYREGICCAGESDKERSSHQCRAKNRDGNCRRWRT